MKVVLAIPDLEKKGCPRFLAGFVPKGLKEPPMGVLYIAAVLEQAGHKVVVIDNFQKNLAEEKFRKLILDEKPDIIGFSVMNPTYEEGKKTMKAIKEELDVPIIVGGVAATLYAEEIVKEPFVDAVVKYEGEHAIFDIINNNKRGIIEGKPFLSLDELPYPARHLINLNDYLRTSVYIDAKPADYLASSRGCPYECTFCASKELWERRYRWRSVKSTVKEIEFLMAEYGSRGIIFREDNFTINEKRVKELCKEIKSRKLEIQWHCESRPNISYELLKEMKEAGCTGLWFGIESGVQKTLDYIKKGTTLKQIRDTIKNCKKLGLKTGGSFMIGLPCETKEDIRQTFKFMKELRLDNTWVGPFIGFPKCELYDEMLKNKWYKLEWNKILVFEKDDLNPNELFAQAEWINNYFRTKRLKLTLKSRKLGEMPALFKDGLKVLYNLIVKRSVMK